MVVYAPLRSASSSAFIKLLENCMRICTRKFGKLIFGFVHFAYRNICIFTKFYDGNYYMALQISALNLWSFLGAAGMSGFKVELPKLLLNQKSMIYEVLINVMILLSHLRTILLYSRKYVY